MSHAAPPAGDDSHRSEPVRDRQITDPSGPRQHADQHVQGRDTKDSSQELQERGTEAPLLATQQLSKTYGAKHTRFDALKNVNLKIYSGDSIAITGKSGSGKSTLMHLLALLDLPSSGQVFLGGNPVSALGPKELARLRNQEFGFVFQQFFLDARNSVLDNVILPLKIARQSGKERKRRGMEALERLGLADKAKNKATDLSGGQKQRVCIARALVNEPSVIFADEPTGNLDTATSEMVENILFGLHRELGITLVIVTHDSELAAKAQREIRMQDGEIEEATR